MERLLEDVWISEAVHQDDADAMAGMCALERRHIVEFDGEADHFQTAYAIALWPERKEVGTCFVMRILSAELEKRPTTRFSQHDSVMRAISPSVAEKGVCASVMQSSACGAAPCDSLPRLLCHLRSGGASGAWHDQPG